LFSLRNIEKLPRHQRLRKITKIFHEAENRLYAADEGAAAAVFKIEELDFFSQIAGLLQKDTMFSAAASAAFRDAAAVLSRTPHNDPPALYRRAFNTIRHILMAETGRSTADWDFISPGGRLDPAQRRIFPGMLVYLEDIRSPFNVGAMFRTAESFGAERVFISPLCADPRHPRAQRSAMGCVDVLPWERCDLSGKDAALPNVPLFALETGGTPLEEFAFPRQGMLIAGSEELGVNPWTLAAADVSLGRVSIPCYGAKGSLNVSVAFGIVMQSWTRKLRFTPSFSGNS
jgi:TrmH family RNA methyltransferase